MKNTIILLVAIISINTYSQTLSVNPTRDDLLGTWEWQNGNEVFRINFFNYSYEYEGETWTSLASHFTMLETDTFGNETIIYTSDKPMGSTIPQNWYPVITGGQYLNYIDSYRFWLIDNTANTYLLGNLDIKFLNVPNGSPLQILWKLRIDGMANEGESFNVPTDIILTKID